MIHHNLFDKLKSGGFAEIELIPVSINNRSRSTVNGFGSGLCPALSLLSSGFTHRT
jgi:hypothetical protein